MQIAEPHHLVLLAVDPRARDTGQMVQTAGNADASSWQWVLEGRAGGGRTRLITRTRTSYRPGSSVLWHVVEPISFVMERRMLLGLRDRAEAAEANAIDPGDLQQ